MNGRQRQGPITGRVRGTTYVTRRTVSSPVKPSQGAAELRLKLARAVADPGSPASILDSENVKSGETTVERAIAAGISYFVTVGPEILALDGDHDQAVDETTTIQIAIKLAGAYSVAVASGGPGRAHVFARFPDQARSDAVASWAKSLGWDPRLTIRPPLTPHREGNAVTLIDPTDPREALVRLRGDEVSPRSVSPRMWTATVDGDHSGYQSRSEYLHAVALAVVNTGGTEPDLHELLLGTDLGAARVFDQRCTDKHLRDRPRQVNKLWTDATTWVESHPSKGTERLEQLATLRAIESQHQWTGTRATSARTLYRTLLDIAQMAGTTQLMVSQRLLAEQSGLQRTTVVAALTELSKQDFIRAGTDEERRQLLHQRAADKRPKAGSIPHLWILNEIKTGPYLSHPIVLEVYGPGIDTSHDLWRNSVGLGKGVLLTYSTLLRATTPLTAPEILARRGGTTGTVGRHLRQLRAFGLIERTGAYWAAVEGVDLDYLAREIGAAGRGDRQKAQHDGERAAHQVNLDKPVTWMGKAVPTA